LGPEGSRRSDAQLLQAVRVPAVRQGGSVIKRCVADTAEQKAYTLVVFASKTERSQTRKLYSQGLDKPEKIATDKHSSLKFSRVWKTTLLTFVFSY